MRQGKDGRQLAAEIGPELDYLSGISRRLGVRDLVADYFTPVVGQWNDLHEEAERWRAAGLAAEHVTRDLTGPLGRLDSAWQGRDADSFVEHMRTVGLAGHDLSDAMHAMADALDETAEGIRGIVEDMSRLFADAADVVSTAASLPLDGDRRVIEVLDDLHDPARELHESVRDVLEAFARLCDGMSGESGFAEVRMSHHYPEKDWAPVLPAKPESGGTAVAGEAKAAATAAAGALSGSVGGSSATVGGGVPGGAVGGGVASSADAPQPLEQGGATAVAEPRPEQPRPAVAAAGAPAPTTAATGGMGMGMGGGMIGAGAGGQQGGDKEHKSKYALSGTSEALLGKPKKTAPPVLGDD
ncbi:hypothetical protein GCM10022243_05130 [Saccharothrix violaceirubra]